MLLRISHFNLNKYRSGLTQQLVKILFCFGVQKCLNGLFIGTGHTLISLFSGIAGAILFRIPACYILGVTLEMGLAGIGLGAPIASAASLVISVVFLLSGKWKKPVIR